MIQIMISVVDEQFVKGPYQPPRGIVMLQSFLKGIEGQELPRRLQGGQGDVGPLTTVHNNRHSMLATGQIRILREMLLILLLFLYSGPAVGLRRIR